MNEKPPLQNLRFKWWEYVTGKRILLAEDNDLNAEIAGEAGMNDFLGKPMNIQDLESVLNIWLS